MEILKIELSEEQMNTIAERAANICEERSSTKTEEKQKFFTVKQVADLTHSTPWTIRNHIKLGVMEASKTGKSWLITQEQIDNYTNQNKKK
jgi:excisionase family DNA binding protein